MIVNDVFFASQIEIWETAFHNWSHIYKIDKDMPLTLWLVWLLPFLFLWLFFSTEILFFASNRNPPSRKISRFRSLYRLSSNNSKKKILMTGTCHWLEPITVILDFWKYYFLEKQLLISELQFFLKVQGSNFQVQYWIDCMFPLMSSLLHAKAVHLCRLLHMQVDFLQYYSTQESNQMNIGCQSSWNEERRMCARSCSIWMEFNSY